MLRYAVVAVLLLTACGSEPRPGSDGVIWNPEGVWAIEIEGECIGELTLYADSSRRLSGEWFCGPWSGLVSAGFFWNRYLEMTMARPGLHPVYASGSLGESSMTLRAWAGGNEQTAIDYVYLWAERQ